MSSDMDRNLQILILDAGLYVFTLLWMYSKYRTLTSGIFVLIVMTISHVGAIFYYDVLRNLGFHIDIPLVSVLYLYMTIMICLYPFIKNKGVYEIKVDTDLITKIAWIFVILSIEPLIENIILLLKPKNYALVYSSFHEDDSNIYKIYSFIGLKLQGFTVHGKVFMTLAFFYLFPRKNVSKYLKFGMGCCMVNYILSGINMASRGTIMMTLFMWICCMLLMYPLYEKQIKAKIKRWALISLIPCLLAFLTITFSRFNEFGNSSGDTVGNWFLLYMSEGPIKFSNEMWNGRHNTDGDVNLSYLKDMAGMKTYTTFKERNEHYRNKNGRDIEVFYTFIGDFISDFDYIPTVLICVFLYCIARKGFARREVSFEYMMIMLFVIHMYSIGFASNIYRSYNLQKTIVYNLVFIVLMRLIQDMKQRKYSVIKR